MIHGVKRFDIVKFHGKVFGPQYAPHYDEYNGHFFEVVRLHEGDHVELKCITGDVVVKGYVHDDELVETNRHTNMIVKSALAYGHKIRMLMLRITEEDYRYHYPLVSDELIPWDPMISNGDAFDLAVKLHIFTRIERTNTGSFFIADPEGDVRFAAIKLYKGITDEHQAARSAIVQAAVNIYEASQD